MKRYELKAHLGIPSYIFEGAGYIFAYAGYIHFSRNINCDIHT